MRIHRMTGLSSLVLLLASISCSLPPPAPGSWPLAPEEPAAQAGPDAASPPPPCSVRILQPSCTGCTIHEEAQKSCGKDCSKLETIDRNVVCRETVQTCAGPVTCACSGCEGK